MFTGLIADLGEVQSVEQSGEGMRLWIASRLASELAAGASIAVNGVCLTATALAPGTFEVEVVNETLRRTSLAGAESGVAVNLELALRATDHLGGHIVQGHVDATGTVEAVTPDGFSERIRVRTEPEILRYVVEKGSIAVDGVSLTVAAVDTSSFTVSLIPETLQRTNLGSATPGRRVNLEVDLVAKYVEKLVSR